MLCYTEFDLLAEVSNVPDTCAFKNVIQVIKQDKVRKKNIGKAIPYIHILISDS